MNDKLKELLGAKSFVKVALTLECPAVRRQNRKIAREAEAKGRAAEGMISASVKKFKSALDKIVSHDQGTRAVFNEFAFPCELQGWSQLRAEKFFAYTEAMEKRFAVRAQLVEDFLRDYEEECERARLDAGDYYDPAAYPSVDKMRSKLGVQHSIRKHRGGIDPEIEAEVEKSKQADIEIAKKQATADVAKRLLGKGKPLTQLSDQLARGRDCATRKQVVANLRGLSADLRDMNVWGIREIEEIADQIADMIPSGSDAEAAESIRENEIVRAKVARDAKALNEKVSKICF